MVRCVRGDPAFGLRAVMLPPKEALKNELVAVLAADLATLERSQLAAQLGATHEEAKPENDKDTRALEQSYLARGQAQRVLALRVQLAEVENMPVRQFGGEDPIALGALVTVEDDEQAQTVFLAPHGGGLVLGAGRIRVVTPASPLGRALLGSRSGDECVIRIGERVRELTVVAVD